MQIKPFSLILPLCATMLDSCSILVISVQPQELIYCQCRQKIKIPSEWRTKLTHRNIQSTLAKSLLYKTGATLATTCSNIDSRGHVAPKNSCNGSSVPAFLQSFQKTGNRQVAYELILGASWQAQNEYFFLCRPRMSIFLEWSSMDHSDFNLNVLFPPIFSWTLMLHRLRGQIGAISVQIHCQYAGVLVQPVHGSQPIQTRRNRVSMHHTFCNIPPTISHLSVAISHLFVALSHLFSGIS